MAARTFSRFEVSMGFRMNSTFGGSFVLKGKERCLTLKLLPDVNAAIMSITARISETWYLLGEQRAQTYFAQANLQQRDCSVIDTGKV